MYIDNPSKIHKCQRIFFFLVIFLPVFSGALINVGRSSSRPMQVVSLLLGLLVVLYACAMLRIFLCILQLSR